MFLNIRMPELPEVEASRRLFDRFIGSRIKAIEIIVKDSLVFGMQAEAIDDEYQGLCSLRLEETGRHGKYFWLKLSDDRTVLMHLGMTGFVQIKGVARSFYRSAPEKPGEPEQWPPRFTRFLIRFEGRESEPVAFGDSRRLGRVSVVRGNIMECEKVKRLGPDPIVNLKASYSLFESGLLGRRVPLKSLLLDQSFIAGVGNWMADDILRIARLYPETPSSSLSAKEARALFEACIELSEKAVECRTLGKEYPDDYLFHVRWGATARNRSFSTPAGEQAVAIRVGGRTTLFIPKIQRKHLPQTD